MELLKEWLPVLASVLIAVSAVLSLRHERMKLLNSASLHLYQQQVEACSALVAKAHELAMDRTAITVGPFNDALLDDFLREVHRVKVVLPSDVIQAVETFWNSIQGFPDRVDFLTLRRDLMGIANKARETLNIEPISAELLQIGLVDNAPDSESKVG